MATALLILGVLAHAVGYFWLVVLAYREAPAAGRAALFVWPIGFLIVFIRWDATIAKPFFLALAGAGLWYLGMRLQPEPPPEKAPAEFHLPQ